MHDTQGNIVLAASYLAKELHRGQTRKYTGEPYINHPAGVVDILASVTSDPATLAAGWLHDTIEDTGTTLDALARSFPPEVCELVDALTERPDRLRPGNRYHRKAQEAARLSRAPEKAQTIKYADLLDNGPSIVQHDPKFARVYVREARELHDMLAHGNNILRAALSHEIRKWCAALTRSELGHD